MLWKYQDFSNAQILREINFVTLKPLKSAIVTILAAMDFEFFENFWHFQVWNSQTSKFKEFKASKIVKMAVFHLVVSAKIDFT